MNIEDVKKNYTTCEQVKRLLKIGLPANSADYYMQNKDSVNESNDINIRASKEQLDEHFFDSEEYIPCWSALRLYMIFDDSAKDEGLKVEGKIIIKHFPASYVEGITICLESLFNANMLDFQKFKY